MTENMSPNLPAPLAKPRFCFVLLLLGFALPGCKTTLEEQAQRSDEVLDRMLKANSSPPILVETARSSTRPYVILAADRSVVRKGEVVEMKVTFVNPTSQEVDIPSTHASWAAQPLKYPSHRRTFRRFEPDGLVKEFVFGSYSSRTEKLAPGAKKTHRFPLFVGGYDYSETLEYVYQFGNKIQYDIEDEFEPVTITFQYSAG